ncbi:MAG: competence/damage-inducible protein A [Alphaproteobacteria bacterium]|nr:competence/damage-inducible protein A [Alphaproteobacteria bacterium]
MPTAAAVIIGNEILTGKFADENGPYLIRRLRTLGTDLRRLVTISDDLDAIASEVRRCSEAFDLVFTTGGVGPTHDDVTLEGVARAFGRSLVVEPRLVALMEAYGVVPDEMTLRMARVPEGTVLEESQASSYPILRCENVWIFPGVPKLLQMKFEALAQRFAGDAVLTDRLYVTARETEIAVPLAEIAARFPNVDIGSYPRFGEGDYRVIVTLESRDPEALRQAVHALRGTLPLREASKPV